MKKYSAEVVEAARVLIAAFLPTDAFQALELPVGIVVGPQVTLPADLVAAAMEGQAAKGPTPADLQALWNDLRDPRLGECIKLHSRRLRAARARLKEFPDKNDWIAFIEVINKNKWLLGVEPSPGWPNWKADFDWFVKPTSIIKFMEGGYREAARYKSARDTYGEDLDQRSAARKKQNDDNKTPAT